MQSSRSNSMFLFIFTQLAVFIQCQSVVEILEDAPGGTVLVDSLQNRFKSPIYPTGRDAQPYMVIGNPLRPGISSLALQIQQHSTHPNVQLVVERGHRGPDREVLCPSPKSASNEALPLNACDLSLVVLYGSPEHPLYGTLILRILDVNDNSPTFPSPATIELRIPERSGRSKTGDNSPYAYPLGPQPTIANKLVLPVAHDLDSRDNGVKLYQLTSVGSQDVDLSLFALGDSDTTDQSSLYNPTQSSPYSSGGNRLSVNSNGLSRAIEKPALFILGDGLDRENMSEVWFNLLAVDGGSPAKTGTLTIRLVVTDLNDNAPKFRKPIYHQPTIPWTPSDNVGNRHLDSSSPGKELLVVSEALPIGSNLATLVADDADEGANSQVDYRLKEVTSDIDANRVASWFRLISSNSSATLSVASELDADSSKAASNSQAVNKRSGQWFQTDPRHGTMLLGQLVVLTVEAVDRGSPSLSNVIKVALLIQNTNDNAPRISILYTNRVDTRDQYGQAVQGGSVVENTDTPVAVAHLNVLDEDYPMVNMGSSSQPAMGIHCQINDSRFSLDNGPKPSRSNSFSGANDEPQSHFFSVTLFKPLDRERAPLLTVEVKCVDEVASNAATYDSYSSPSTASSPVTQLTGSILLRIHIQDVNDNTPKFTSDFYRFNVIETVDNSPSMHSSRIYSDDPGRSRVKVGQVQAIDPDEDDNGRVEYNLVTSPDSDAFEVDSTTGVIWRVGRLDREKAEKVALTIQARDNGKPQPLSSTCTVEVHIDDVNDNAPYWVAPVNDHVGSNYYTFASGEDGVFYFEVYENQPIGALVGAVNAVDLDIPNKMSASGQDNTSTMVYSFRRASESTRPFTINPRDGELRLTVQLDREKCAHYELGVLAMDNYHQLTSVDYINRRNDDNISRGQHFTITATVIISVLDVNDNYPQFESPYAGQEVLLEPGSSLTTAGSTLFTVKANDPDNGDNGTVRYRLNDDKRLGSAIHSLVEIDATTGVCYLRESFTVERLRNLIGNKPLSFELDSVGIMADRNERRKSQSISLPINVMAYDIGRPHSLNSTRTVRLVWLSNPIGSGPDTLVSSFGETLARFSQQGSSSGAALIIPLICGILLFILIVAIVLAVVLHLRRRSARRHSPDKTGSSQANQWRPNYSSPGQASNVRMGPKSADVYRSCEAVESRALEDRYNREFIGNENDCSLYQTLPDTMPKTYQGYLPDCVPMPETRGMLVKRPETALSRMAGARSVVPFGYPGTQKYAPSMLSRALSEESLAYSRNGDRWFSFDDFMNGQQGDVSYTTLSAFPPPSSGQLFQPTAVFRQMPAAGTYHPASSASFYNIADQLNCTPPVSRRGRTQAASIGEQYSVGLTRANAGVAEELTPDHEDGRQPATSGQQHEGSGWKAKLSDTYAEHTFI